MALNLQKLNMPNILFKNTIECGISAKVDDETGYYPHTNSINNLKDLYSLYYNVIEDFDNKISNTRLSIKTRYLKNPDELSFLFY